MQTTPSTSTKKRNEQDISGKAGLAPWCILNESYLYQTIRYIEYNPIEAGLSNIVGEYPDTLSAALFAKEVIPQCAKKSMLIKQYDSDPK